MAANPSGERGQGIEEQRVSIGSIRRRWRLPLSIIYIAQALPGMSFIIWTELAWTIDDSPMDTFKATLWGITLVGAASIATTGTFAEVFELMLGTRDIINDWLKNRRDEAKEEGVEIGVGRGLAKAQDWHNRRQAALEKGEPFDEPPPWDNKR